MSAFRWFRENALPARASTQTWMVLTFVLFVGMAVLVIDLYVALVLRVRINEAVQQTLVQQAERVAILIERVGTPGETEEIIQSINRLTDWRLVVAASDTARWSTQEGDFLGSGDLRRYDAWTSSAGEVRFAERIAPGGEHLVYVALRRPASGLIVSIGMPLPPLFALVRAMQTALIVGMVMALLLAVLGSWIAAQKVTRPLQAIRNSARSISEGRLDEKIRVDTRAAEIQDLAKSLNHMSDSFREKIEELERMTRLQGEFIGNVSHEVRNPIFAVSGYLEALGSSSLDDAQRKRYAEKGLVNLQRLNSLFNDLIEIARLEYREDLIKHATFDLQELLDEVADILRPKASAKGLDLTVSNKPVNVRADRNRIRQVLINLIDNAIAYTDKGTIRCRSQRRLDKIRIEVVDTGRGIAGEHRERIFERFYRVDTDRSRRSGGTGLGLSIVKQILQAHGETIHVESTLGRGTRFWFELPYAGRPAEVRV